jgi:hypothetical protein
MVDRHYPMRSRKWRRELVEDLGGEESISTQQSA